MRRIRTIFIALLTLSLALLLVLGFVARKGIEEVFGKEYELYRSVKIGMTEEDVVKLLGQPYKVYTAPGAPANYYVEGYARKERAITNKVFIYKGTEPIAYIYFDHQNKVEDVFVGGS